MSAFAISPNGALCAVSVSVATVSVGDGLRAVVARRAADEVLRPGAVMGVHTGLGSRRVGHVGLRRDGRGRRRRRSDRRGVRRGGRGRRRRHLGRIEVRRVAALADGACRDAVRSPRHTLRSRRAWSLPTHRRPSGAPKVPSYGSAGTTSRRSSLSRMPLKASAGTASTKKAATTSATMVTRLNMVTSLDALMEWSDLSALTESPPPTEADRWSKTPREARAT